MKAYWVCTLEREWCGRKRKGEYRKGDSVLRGAVACACVGGVEREVGCNEKRRPCVQQDRLFVE